MTNERLWRVCWRSYENGETLVVRSCAWLDVPIGRAIELIAWAKTAYCVTAPADYWLEPCTAPAADNE